MSAAGGNCPYPDRCPIPGPHEHIGADVVVPPACEPGAKHDGAKDRWDLLPWAPVRDVVRVLTYGAKKYAPNNWQLVEGARDRYFAAAQRHLVAWREGEAIDPESGLPHLAHAACSLLFLAWFEARK